MANELIYSDIVVDKSITNPGIDKNSALDNNAPFSFFDFLKYTSSTYTPAEYNTFYTSYLTKWSSTRQSVVPTSQFIAEQYVELLKDISLNYTTDAEKRFLSNIDFTNPLDLDVALPFYSKKLKEIIIFYKKKRDTGTFVIERNKIKGTNHSIERAIYDTIVSYLFSDDSIQNFSLINYNIENIKRNLEINISEFVDVYTNYFDLPREPENESALREELYTYNTNSIDPDIFFNKDNEVTKQIFGSSVYLSEIPIAVNTTLNYNPVCSLTNPLEMLIVDDSKDLLGADERVALRKRFYQKYLGTDFYYLSTNSTRDSLSGRFIEADNPSGNLLNLQTVDIAGVESTELTDLRNIGLFFKPDKQGILRVTSQTYEYSVNKDLLEPDTIYIFPDPSVYGNVSLNQQAKYPLLYTFNIRSDIRNITSGIAYGDPKIDSGGQSFSPYYSRQQNKNKFDRRDVYIDMSDLYNEGVVQKWQTDIFGNQYAIFKDTFGQYFVNTVSPGAQYVKCLTLDGHTFFDPIEGYNFDYSIYENTGSETIRSGLTSRTVTNQVPGTSFSLSGISPLYLNFRQIYPYQSCGFTSTSAANEKCAKLFECGSFVKSDGTRLPDPIAADLSAYPSGYYYYDTFLGGGIGSLDPPSRALINSPLSANFTYSIAGYISSAGAAAYECGRFSDIITICDLEDSRLYVDTVEESSKTVLSTISGTDSFTPISEYRGLEGKTYIRPVGSTSSTILSAALSATIVKYNSYVQDKINNNLLDFDIIYDSVFLESNDVLLIDKIRYTDGGYTQPKTKNTYYVTNSANKFNKISNRFFREDKNTVMFAIMEEFPELSGSSEKIIFPNIYKYSIQENKVIKLWPKNTYTDVKSVSAYYSVPQSSLSANIVSIGKPRLAYNSKNSVWKLTYIGKDLNAFPHMFDITIKEQGTSINVIDSKVYTMTSKASNTTNWASPSASYVNITKHNLTNDPSTTYGLYWIS